MVEILENWGVKFRTSFVADISCARITMMSDDSQTKVLNYPYWVNILPQENSKSGMTIFWPTELELSQNATPFLVSSPSAQSIPLDSFQANPFIVQESDFTEYKPGTKILCAKISGELNGLFTTNSTNNSNIIVIPDQYFVNSLMTGYIGGEYGDYRNFEFNFSQFDFTKYDYVVDCIDTVTGKLQLIEAAKVAGVPVISSMGAGNKLDPTAFEVADISKTSVCPLAKVMRRELKKRNIRNVKVVYSKEEPVEAKISLKEAEVQDSSRRSIPASCAFVPSVAGLILAGEVIRDLTGIMRKVRE